MILYESLKKTVTYPPQHLFLSLFFYSIKLTRTRCLSQAGYKLKFAVINCFFMPLSHSHPQSPSFLGHVVGKRGALEAAATGCQKYGRPCAEVTNITAPAHNGFLSLTGHSRPQSPLFLLSRVALGTRMLTAPLGEKFYFLSSLQRVASLGCFENAPLHSTWIH